METVKITSENYAKTVEGSTVPVIIDFWAEWCGPCRMMSPVIEKLASDCDGSYAVGKVNVDDEPELANRFGIKMIPTFVCVRGGEVKGTLIGVKTEKDLRGLLEK